VEVGARVGLVADNDAYFRMAVSVILNRDLDFSGVVEAASLDEAVERLGEDSCITIALFDLSMPGMKAPTNLRAVR
jgi:DNA-binding NarL/FixJ family response regulator